MNIIHIITDNNNNMTRGMRRNLVWGDVINKKCIIFNLYFLLLYKKKNAIKAEILLDFTLNSLIICSEDNGMSQCMFINTNPFNRNCPVVFLKYVFKRLRLKKKVYGGNISPIIPSPAHTTEHDDMEHFVTFRSTLKHQ
jgi:hypothetical protein